MSTRSQHDCYRKDPWFSLTSVEHERHERAIARLRYQLFRKYTARHYWLAPESEKVLPASPYYDIKAGGMPAPRALHLGGLAYQVASPRVGCSYAVQVEHWSGNEFAIWLTVHPSGKGTFTRFSVYERFEGVDERLHELIAIARHEDSPTSTPSKR